MLVSRHVELAALIVAGHVRDARMASDEVPVLIRAIHATLVDLEGVADRTVAASVEDAAAAEIAAVEDVLPPDAPGDDVHTVEAVPAVTADAEPTPEEDAAAGFVRDGRPTLFDDHLVCLEDGRDVVLLSRHLGRLGISPEDYRAKWTLPSDYPMVSPLYSRGKREAALRSMFGRSTGVNRTAPAPVAEPAPRRRGRLSPNYANA